MEPHHDDPLTAWMKSHPIAYFFVVYAIALAAGTVLLDFVYFLDPNAWPVTIASKYFAALCCAVGAHAGLSWRRRKRRKPVR